MNTQTEFERREAEAMRRLMPSEVKVFRSRQTYVRYMATSRPAINLPRELRQEAAQDPRLEWNPETFSYKYRRRAKLDVAAEGGGPEKLKDEGT